MKKRYVTCLLCSKASTHTHYVRMEEYLMGDDLYWRQYIEGVLGNIRKYVRSFGYPGVFFESMGSHAGGIPGCLWRVKPGVGKKYLSDNHGFAMECIKAKYPIPMGEAYLLIKDVFKSGYTRKIYNSRGSMKEESSEWYDPILQSDVKKFYFRYTAYDRDPLGCAARILDLRADVELPEEECEYISKKMHTKMDLNMIPKTLDIIEEYKECLDLPTAD